MIEGVVSRRMDVEEALRRSGRLKPLQFTFAPPNRLMRVLGSIAEVDIRSLTRGSAQASHGLSPMRRCTKPAFRRRAPAGAGVLLLLTYVNDGPTSRREDFPRV